MNRENRDLASQIVNSDYISVSNDSRNRFEGKVKILLSQKRMPDMSWSDAEIQGFLSDVALMGHNHTEFSSNLCRYE